MNKIAQYLQEHLLGEVMASPDAREYFSTDASIFKLTPQIVVYPRNENDIRKTARFAWQLAERGRAIPITARGLGTDLSGAALGSGIMLVFPAHLNKILAMDSGKNFVVVQPGINYGKLQQTLHTHGLFLPPFPASLEFSTIGGAIANNSAGEKSVKYGVTEDYVKELRMTLANGEVIATKKLSKRELNHKKGLANFEGEIYRSIDNLLNDNAEVIEASRSSLSKNNVGYNLWDIKDKDGSFDLTPLFIGSQGTLGIVCEAKLDTENYNPSTILAVGFFEDIASAQVALLKLVDLKPSALEMVDEKLLEFIDTTNPNQLKGLVEKPYAKMVFLIEFDDLQHRVRTRKAKKAQKILEEYAKEFRISEDEYEQEELWKIRHSSATISWHSDGNKKALPIVEDAVVPLEKIEDFFKQVYDLFGRYNLDFAVWGHAGNGNFHIQPFMDLSEVGDRQKIYKLMNSYYAMILELGGAISGEHNDGRLRGPFVKLQYPEEIYELFTKIKQIFDPYNILNPGVKIGVDINDVQPLIRQEYSFAHFYNHMPRT
jgi:FAD/FMN-containing dehydrogenase